MSLRIRLRRAGMPWRPRAVRWAAWLRPSSPALMAAAVAGVCVLGLVAQTATAEGDRAALTALATDFSRPEVGESLSAGKATVPSLTIEDVMHAGKVEVFSRPVTGLTPEQAARFKRGNELFRTEWAAAGTAETDDETVGLGPLFNAPSCVACHVNDGRGLTPHSADSTTVSLLLRLLQPPATKVAAADGAPHDVTRPGDPIYGSQLQNFAVDGVAAEGRVRVHYRERAISFPDGTSVSLREPLYEIAEPNYGALSNKTILSARLAPQMVGLGLLEAIEAADILAGADPDDANQDGISGEPAYALNPASREVELGRFGWRGEAATLAHQIANAFAADIGIGTPVHPSTRGDCTDAQAGCLAQDGDEDASGHEASQEMLDLIAFYSAVLGVPGRRGLEKPEVTEGKGIFYAIGCTGCHTPKFVTGDSAPVPQLAGQLIWPYTDMLLHDMGPGLADQPHDERGYSEQHAVPNLLSSTAPAPDRSLYEWKTPPLWGIGLTEMVSGRTYFLHDGRARNLAEAILWHGGEAKPSRDKFQRLTPDDRRKLIAFLNSL